MARLGDCDDILSTLTFRPLHKDELAQLIKMCRDENWLLVENDLYLAYSNQPGAFIGAMTPSNELISHVSLSKWGDSIANLGFYITHPMFRGRGIGSRLFKFAMEKAKNRIVVLHAAPGTQKIYERYGFKYEFNIQMLKADVLSTDEFIQHAFHSAVDVAQITTDTLDQVCKYDMTVSRADRSALLKSWFSSPDALSLCATDDTSSDVVGVISLRRGDDAGTWMVSSFYAESEKIAGRLLYEAIKNTNARKLFGLCPERNFQGTAMFGRLGLKRFDAFCLSRMVYPGNKSVSFPVEKVYAMMTRANCHI